MERVSFSYKEGTQNALHGFRLSVSAGECVLLCGESGCGKTTVTRLINGLVPHYYEGSLEGHIEVCGVNPGDVPLESLAGTVGSVFQNPRSQFFCVDTTSEIAFGCENLGLPEDVIRRRVESVSEQMNLTKLLGRSLFKLSGGEKQKIACAGVCAMEPAIYVLDEPTSNLDLNAIGELREILLLWKRMGKTVVIAEHRLGWLREVCDRVFLLEGGTNAGEFAAAEFFAKNKAELNAMGLRSAGESVDLLGTAPGFYRLSAEAIFAGEPAAGERAVRACDAEKSAAGGHAVRTCDAEESAAGGHVVRACDAEEPAAGGHAVRACDAEEPAAGGHAVRTCDAEEPAAGGHAVRACDIEKFALEKRTVKACDANPSDSEAYMLRNFSYSYGKQRALHIPALTVPAHSVVAVIGRNGAGKSTFANCLCGLKKGFRGSVAVGGKTYSRKNLRGLSYMVMQEVNHQLFTESVLEEVTLGMEHRGGKTAEVTSGMERRDGGTAKATSGMERRDEKAAEEMLERLDLLPLKERHPMSLSGGQKQRTAIASALLSGRPVLVLDEPTSGLDFRHMRETAELIRMAAKEKTIFIVTHDMEFIAQCCTHMLHIENGEGGF